MRHSGQIIVLMYHIIATDVTRPEWTRTPAELSNDIALLKAEGYFPINLRDLVHGRVEVPGGNSPVVLTFDDSTPGQYRLLPDGALDPDCAVGILQAAAAEETGLTGRRSSVAGGGRPQRIVFGQPEWRVQNYGTL